MAELTNKDANALKTFNEFGYNLADFLKDVIRRDKPKVVVLGRNIANAFHLFSEALNKQLGNLIDKNLIKKALLGEGASLIGAASLWDGVEEEIVENVRA